LAGIATALNATVEQIQDIAEMKSGMTNRSYLFSCNGERYIIRIPGEGTDKLINRAQEAAAYRAISSLDISEPLVSIDPQTGHKLTRFLDGVRNCDPGNPEEVCCCMQALRSFHELGLEVDHGFDPINELLYYEQLRNGDSSLYPDYEQTKAGVLELGEWVATLDRPRTLAHIDAVCDNFLFAPDPATGQERIFLIDWEYAGMQDPHIDIAMFAIYALYDRQQILTLIDAYFPEGCPDQTRAKIYGYIAICGLLWSNWCEFKRALGVDFGSYAQAQYRYAQDYYSIARQEVELL
jgi:thiamine kinase-like enzyme